MSHLTSLHANDLKVLVMVILSPRSTHMYISSEYNECLGPGAETTNEGSHLTR